MSDIFVTVLIDNDQNVVMPGVEGENSQAQAQQKADYWEGLGHTAKVGRVELLKEAIPERRPNS